MKVLWERSDTLPSSMRSVVVPEHASVDMSPFPVKGVSLHEVLMLVQPYFKKASISEVDSGAFIIKARSFHDVCIVSSGDRANKLVHLSSTQVLYPLVASVKCLSSLLSGLA